VTDHLHTLDDVAARIRRGEGLLLAGDEALLRRLPRGNWIAGTIPYFVSAEGGHVDREHVFVHALAGGLSFAGIRRYRETDVDRVYAELPPNGFGVMIAPASSAVHLSFALNAPSYQDFAGRPLVGWISGVHLSELGKRAPLVFDGASGAALDQHAVVMHVSVPEGKAADIQILNIFEAGDGPAITFPSSGFTAREVEVAGVRRKLSEYVKEAGLDTRLPLVADYLGSSVNVSFQGVDHDQGVVSFYAPVFAGIRYHHARPVKDYVAEFSSRIPQGIDEKVAFSCNCILNYLHSGMEGRKVGGPQCPITFGEIAYQLLNQTMAYVTIDDAAG
jgi:hypothetical protein